MDPFSALADKQTQARKAREAENENPGNTSRSPDPCPGTPPATTAAPAERPLPQSPPLPPPAPSRPSAPSRTEASEPQDTPENKAGKAEVIKNALIQASGGWGFAYETEHPILGGKGRVDIVLTKGNLVVACEISATTSAPHEVPNVLKCVEAGFARIIHVCNAKARRTRLAAMVAAQCAPADLCRIEYLTLGETLLRVAELASTQLDGEDVGVGRKAALTPFGEMSAEDRNAAIDAAWAKINGNKSSDRGKLHPPG